MASAFVGGPFEHDVFVSYAHGVAAADESPGDLKRWTEAFVDKLEQLLKEHFRGQGDPVQVFIDKDLSRTKYITDELKRKAEKSALLLVFMTNSYLHSEWCKKEREWFEEEIERRGEGVEKIFVVRAKPTDAAAWPRGLKDSEGETVLGFKFYKGKEGRVTLPFGWPDPDRASAESLGGYYEELTELASSIADVLKDLKRRHEERRDSISGTAAPANRARRRAKWPIMIAPPTADTASFAGQARLRLEQEGCAVLPTSPDLIDRIRFADVEEAIQKSRACLQLIGVQDAGPERCAWAISSMAEGCGLKQVFWKPFDFPLACLDTMPTYRSFVESLGQLPPAEVDDVVKELVDFIDSEANEGAGNGPLAAYIEVPPDVIETYEHLYARLDSQDCVLYPRNISLDPDVKVMDQDQTARKLIYPSCDAIVFYYCMEDRLNWLTEAYISCERTVVQIRRTGGLVPKRIVVDLVGETDRVANDLGFPVIPWSETGRPDKLWQRVREIAS